MLSLIRLLVAFVFFFRLSIAKDCVLPISPVYLSYDECASNCIGCEDDNHSFAHNCELTTTCCTTEKAKILLPPNFGCVKQNCSDSVAQASFERFLQDCAMNDLTVDSLLTPVGYTYKEFGKSSNHGHLSSFDSNPTEVTTEVSNEAPTETTTTLPEKAAVTTRATTETTTEAFPSSASLLSQATATASSRQSQSPAVDHTKYKPVPIAAIVAPSVIGSLAFALLVYCWWRRHGRNGKGRGLARDIELSPGPGKAAEDSDANSTTERPTGIQLLYDLDGSIVDIIFVHGLGGHREKTWTANGAPRPWPETLLPTEVPNARILTFGYDSRVTDWRGMVSESRIGHHAMELLTAITHYRENDNTDSRPIIFVCHSLGGLVCESALAKAAHRPEKHLKQVLNSTVGIAFLGTPHHGAGLANWAATLARSIGVLKQTNSEILGVLRSESEVLEILQDSFHTMIRSRHQDGLPPIEITCFHEAKALPGLGFVVPPKSAILSGYIPIPIQKTHSEMTKFERLDDSGFRAIAGELRRWVRNLQEGRDAGPE